ncbi:hypothetical protein JM18_007291 [Phytophthora kernoviae]|uniref:Uncharacterized protein n=1 Tax=Phytophthora kernoviae TaxID=325452 RepID=A0A921V5X1_9STRA|nr:hypothetical protein JM18_007291 [Phytophthora kernoviae]
MVDTDAVALGTMGVNSIADLTGLSFDKTLVLRQIMPICDYIALAKLVVEQCTVQATQYEGQEYANVNTSCVFEYYLLNTVQQLVVRNWTLTLGELDIGSWLDSGTFMLRIRARDPAGNVDEKFEDGRNEYTWEYVRPLPWGLIIGLSCVALVLLAGFLMEWRKRRKRAAMERYAMKRMRRKLKKKNGAVATAKEGDANWRETYDNAKDGKKGKKKSTKRKPTISKDKAKNKDKKETAKRKEKSASKSKTKDNSKVKDKTKTKSKKDDGKKTTKKTLTKDEKKKKTRASDTTGKTKAKTKDVSTKTKMKGSTKTTEKRASTASKKDKSDKKKPHDKSKSSEKKKTK